MSHTFLTQIERTVGDKTEEIHVNVEFDFTKGMKGGRGPYGEPLEPDDEEYIDVVSVRRVDGQPIDLTNAEQEQVEQACWNHLEKQSKY